MTLPIPLTVRLANSNVDRHVTRDLRGLSFRSVIPGGFASAMFSLDRPLSVDSPELARYTRVYVYDTRNGNIAWNGWLEQPGATASSDGQVWEVAAIGPSAHASDREVPLIYVDTSLERWERHNSSRWNVTESTTVDDSGSEALEHTYPDGMTVQNGDRVTSYYRTIFESNQYLARLRADIVNNVISTNYVNRIITCCSTVIEDFSNWSTTPTTLYAYLGGGTGHALTAGRQYGYLRVERTGAGSSTIGADLVATWSNVVVRGRLKDASGGDVTTGYTNDTITFTEVITDLLGRLLTKYDGPSASIATVAGANIDQLVYREAVTAAKVLEDLASFESDYSWAAWEEQPNGKYRFEFFAWPTDTVRYEASIRDGYSSTGSGAELFNAVNVSWRDPRGKLRYTRRTLPVPELDDAGLTREALIHLDDEVASSGNAQRIGATFLQAHKRSLAGGTLTVAHPILDWNTGIMVQPWELRPGGLIRLRELTTPRAPFDVASRMGQNTFKVTAVDYDTGSGAATLELDVTAPSVEEMLARLRQMPRRPVLTRRRR